MKQINLFDRRRRAFGRLRKMAARVEMYLAKGHLSSAALTSQAAVQLVCQHYGKPHPAYIQPGHEECMAFLRLARIRQREEETKQVARDYYASLR